jgi:uncharacterized protein (TIRG00374 family)
MIKVLLVVALFLVGVVLAGSVFQISGVDEVLGVLSEFEWWGIVPLLVLSAAHVVLAAWRWQVILRAQGDEVPLRKLLSPWLAGYAFSYLSPVVFLGGEGVRTYILKSRFNIPLHRGAASVILDQIISGTFVLLTVFLSAALLISFSGLPHITRVLATVSAVILVLGAGLAVLYAQAFRNKHILQPLLRLFSLQRTRFGRFLGKFEDDIIVFLDVRSSTLWLVFLISALRQATFVARNAAILFFLGQGVDVIKATVIMGATYVGYLVPIPAALGTQEASQTLLFSIAGQGGSTGAAFSVIFRVSEVGVAVVGILVLLRSAADLMALGVLRRFNLNHD